jgi:hypothetical protein
MARKPRLDIAFGPSSGRVARVGASRANARARADSACARSRPELGRAERVAERER